MNTHPWDWVAAQVTWADLPGYIGGTLVVASLMMKLIIPLRTLALLSNLCFIVYAYLHAQYPTLFLHALLVPLNGLRLMQMLKLIRRVRAAAQGENTMTLMKPYMKRRRCKAGETLFQKGAVARDLHYIVSGKFLVSEIGMILTAGQFVGELGLLAPGRLRTQSLECSEDGELLSMTYEHVMELFFQNPDFGFHFLQLTTSRLFQNHEALQAQLAELQAAQADGGTPPRA